MPRENCPELTAAQQALRQAKLSQSWQQISEGSGLGIEWLRKVAADRIPDPGIRKIARLRAYLEERQ